MSILLAKFCEVILLTKFVVLFQCLLLSRSARLREKQCSFRTLLSLAGLRRDHLRPCINGTATVSKAFPEHFHQKQLKVCLNHVSTIRVLLWRMHLWEAAGAFPSLMWVETMPHHQWFGLISVITLQRMELYPSSIFQLTHLGSTLARRQIGSVPAAAT